MVAEKGLKPRSSIGNVHLPNSQTTFSLRCEYPHLCVTLKTPSHLLSPGKEAGPSHHSAKGGFKMVESRKDKIAFKIALPSKPCAKPAGVQVGSCEVPVAVTPWKWKAVFSAWTIWKVLVKITVTPAGHGEVKYSDRIVLPLPGGSEPRTGGSGPHCPPSPSPHLHRFALSASLQPRELQVPPTNAGERLRRVSLAPALLLRQPGPS